MAMNNRDRVGKGFDYLSEGLQDVVDEVMARAFGSTDWNLDWAEDEAQKHGTPLRQYAKYDVQIQLRAITEQGFRFKDVLSRAQQGFASELREARNRWAHGDTFSSDDAVRTLDTIERLLRAVDAPDSAADVQKLRTDLQRTVFEEQARYQVKRTKVSLEPTAGLRPWREVIRPHDDVARGDFTASEFAADLHLVHSGAAMSPEYADPKEFFSRTYLTAGLRDLLSRALRRLSGQAASPVVNLQTNFGGGKTHSMLALYHLFSGLSIQEFPQELQELISESGNPDLSALGVKRAALVGTYLKAGSPSTKEDGTQVHTLWGELAWQLGGRTAYDIVADDDRAGTNPGEALRTLLKQNSPALILIDEWVAYARQLVTEKELPAGSFETQFTFAQSLTEIVQSIPGVMLVVSIPASDSSEESRGSDIEIGGANGQLALERLQNVIRRVADQWRPSSKDESFEIVRRRLFQNPDAQGLTAIAATAKNFVQLYRSNTALFPREAASPHDEYEKRIRASYPLHPELLDRLYEDWSTLERFQRTRGVLKLVSAIVHELWADNDQSPLILPGNVPLDATSVNTDLTQYLEDQWKPIIDSDIDGDASTAHHIDLDRPNLGQRSTTQRIARTIFMGAAPRKSSTRKGLDKQYVWLGTAVPGDALGNFGNAIELLAQRSTFFYEEQGHYWFDTQPSVTKTANDYAERLREDPELVWNEISGRLHSEGKTRGLFASVHVAPSSSADIPDLEDTRLVIVHPKYSRRKQDGAESDVYRWVRQAIESKGGSQRVHRNSLVFLVADRSELEALESAVRSYLGWKKVQETSDTLNLSSQQSKQARESVARHNQTVTDRIRSTYVWAMYPQQLDPAQTFDIMSERIPDSGGMSLAERVGTRLVREEQLVTELGATILGYTLHQELGTLWEGKGELTVGELWGYFTRYVYMPRLIGRHVLDRAVASALTSEVMVHGERFAIAHGKDEVTGRYRGLVSPPDAGAIVQVTDGILLVNYEAARSQLEADRIAAQGEVAQVVPSAATPDKAVPGISRGEGQRPVIPVTASPQEVEDIPAVTTFFGSVSLDPEKYSRDWATVAKEIIDRLAGSGASLELSLEVHATKATGFTESEIRTIRENSRTLKFDPGSDFE